MRSKHFVDVGGEPTLDEILRDPVIQAVMACEGVGREEIDELIQDPDFGSDEPYCHC